VLRSARPARLALIGVVATLAVVGVLLVSGDARFAFIGLAMAFLLLPLVAAGLIPLLARLGLIDDEAASRMGCLHGLGLLSLPVVLLAMYVFAESPLVIIAFPALILGTVYGGDVLVAVAFRLGLTKHRSVLDRGRSTGRTPRPRSIRDPGRAALSSVVDGHMAVLRATERERYGPAQAVGRLLLVVALPMFMVAVIGVMIAVGGYDGTPMIGTGVVGTALCLLIGFALAKTDHGA
jgi:hypothetical protein